MVRKCSEDDGEMTAATAGRNMYRLVAVSFGLLCSLQIALNITLHLLLYRDNLNMEASCKNLTEERDELQRKLTDFGKYKERNTLAIKSLTEERDELKRNLTDFVTAYCFQKEWVYVSGSVYYISSIKKTWDESKRDCEQRGADLIIINSREEQNFTRQQKDNIWIGLTDRETEGKWKWVDGTPLTTSFWASNEPNSYKSEEDCAEVRFHKKENSWNDKPCDHPNFWICEKKVHL